MLNEGPKLHIFLATIFSNNFSLVSVSFVILIHIVDAVILISLRVCILIVREEKN